MSFKPTTNLNRLLHGLCLPLPVFCQVSVKVFLEQTSKAVSYWTLPWSWFAPVNALCNLLCKKSWEVAAWLQGWFLSRRCFMLCITTEVEPKIAKQYKCHHCCSCKNYRGKGMKGKKKVSWCHFLADQKIAISWKKCVLGHPIAQATSYCLLPDTFWLRAFKNAFEVGKFIVSLVQFMLWYKQKYTCMSGSSDSLVQFMLWYKQKYTCMSGSSDSLVQFMSWYKQKI